MKPDLQAAAEHFLLMNCDCDADDPPARARALEVLVKLLEETEKRAADAYVATMLAAGDKPK